MAGAQARPTARLGLLLALAWAPLAAGGAQRDPGAGSPPEPLRAEIRTSRAIYDPSQPIRVRFALINQSDATVELPLTRPLEGHAGISLPLELVTGTPEQPALYVAYQGGKPVAVRAAAPGEPTTEVLRLGPHGSVGTLVDLRGLYRRVRYSGSYRLEWRPLGGRLGTVTAAFRVEPRQDAVLVVDYGKVTFSLMYDKAPLNVENFLELARDGFYNSKTLHRVVPGFLIQGGCPNGDGTGIRPDGKLVPAEFHDAPFRLGTLAMARKPNDPNSASCQFFVTLARLPELDRQYTVIGQASDEESLRTLQQLATVPTDERHRPRRPLIIRSINLVDADTSRPAARLNGARP